MAKRQPDPDRDNLKTLSVPEVARQLSVTAHTVNKLIKAGLIDAKVFPGGRSRIAIAEIAAFKARQGR